MATDMDIEMDIDMGFSEQDLAIQHIEIVPESEVSLTLALLIPKCYELNTNFGDRPLSKSTMGQLRMIAAHQMPSSLLRQRSTSAA
jgi:hypothetical protein